jgi:hypothetical protein
MTTRAALVWIILGIGLACTTPAMAQTYDPYYPFCIEKYYMGIDCSFTSMAQCNGTASGGVGYCYANPYFRLQGRAVPAARVAPTSGRISTGTRRPRQ